MPLVKFRLVNCFAKSGNQMKKMPSSGKMPREIRFSLRAIIMFISAISREKILPKFIASTKRL
jgi:hypothetical protein